VGTVDDGAVLWPTRPWAICSLDRDWARNRPSAGEDGMCPLPKVNTLAQEARPEYESRLFSLARRSQAKSTIAPTLSSITYLGGTCLSR